MSHDPTKPVHLGKRHKRTGMFGTFNTPLADISTACVEVWIGPERPQRTMKPSLVTCPTCLAFCRALDITDFNFHKRDRLLP